MYKVDVYLRVRRAVMVDGMSIREASRVFGLHRDTVRKMLVFSVPPGYLRQSPPKRPKLEPFTGVIDRILGDDLGRPRKQRHTAKRIFERLREEYRFDGQYTIVKDYVREHRRQSREMFVPLSHAPGHELMEARDERRLLSLQGQLSRLSLLIIDELGFVPLSPTGAELLFEVFSQRYERGSILVTTNLPFDEWTEVFGSERLTGALLDRLTHHVHILEMNGESYRLKRSREGVASQTQDKPQPADHRRTGLRAPVTHRGGTALRGLQPALRAGLNPGDHQPSLRRVDRGLRVGEAHRGPAGPPHPPRPHPGDERRELPAQA